MPFKARQMRGSGTPRDLVFELCKAVGIEAEGTFLVSNRDGTHAFVSIKKSTEREGKIHLERTTMFNFQSTYSIQKMTQPFYVYVLRDF